MILPGAPRAYDQRDQDAVRGVLQDSVTALEQLMRLVAWQSPTGTATRTAFDTTTVTLPQLAEHVKALVDDLRSIKS